MLAQTLKKRLALTAFLVSTGIGAQASAAPMSIRTLAAGETRLATVAYRISAANSHTCSTPTMMSGLVVHDLTQYPAAGRAAVSRAFSLHEGIGVVGVVKDSGADRAGLRIDDEILAIGDRRVDDAAAWTHTTPSYDRVDRFMATMSATTQSGATVLLVRRQGALLRLPLSTLAGCGGSVKYVDSSNVNAWSDGRHVVLNAGIVAMAQSDDELAFVIAHEMAHNILGHVGPADPAPRGLFGRMFSASGAQNSESQADSAAVSLMRRGGYAPEGGVNFLQTARRKMWWALSLGHPGFASRLRTVATAIAAHEPPNAALVTTAALQSTTAPATGPAQLTLSSIEGQAFCRPPYGWSRPCVVRATSDALRRQQIARDGTTPG